MTLSVDTSTTFQTISGFGAAGAFVDTFDSGDADYLFGTLALSVFRSELSTVMTPTIQGWPMMDLDSGGHGPSTFQAELQAYDRGCRQFLVSAWVAATDTLNGPFPWNVSGGANTALSTSHYADFATAFTTYCDNLLAAGLTDVKIFVSPANEPDITPGYAQTSWTTTQLLDFILNHLGPALLAWGIAHPDWQAASGQASPQVLYGEVAEWSVLSTWIAAAEADTAALAYIGLYGTHQYFGGGASAPPTPCSRPIWETEAFNQGTSFDATMTDAMAEINLVYEGLTTGMAETWLYWVFVDDGDDDNSGLIGNSADSPTILTKRSYCMGNFSKFIVPGSIRIGCSSAPSGVNATAYKLPDGRLAVVCINTNGSSTPLSVSVSGTTLTSVVPWVTDASNNLVSSSSIPVSSGAFSSTLGANSVTSFVQPTIGSPIAVDLNYKSVTF
jgi:glucuronoarabinoxylan endo-1,4-beta-xylanase